MDRALLKVIDAEVEVAVKAIGEKYGLDITTSGGSFNVNTASLKLAIAHVGVDGVVESKGMLALKTHHSNLVDHTFFGQGKKYRIVGYKPRSPKNCFEIEDAATGKVYICGWDFTGLEDPRALKPMFGNH